MSKMEAAYVRQLLEEHDKREEQVPYNAVLRDFRRDVEAAIPGCRTTLRNNNWAWVYMPEDHIAMGAIGFGNFSQNGKGGNVYAVHARNIVNGKYSSGSTQHNMVMSSNCSVAVKSAKKFLRRLSPKELVEHTYSHVRDAISQMRQSAREVMTSEEVRLFGAGLYNRKDAPVLVELKRLITSEHTFFDTTLTDRLTEYFALGAENDNAQQPYNMLFVSITQGGGKQRFDVVPVDKAENHWPMMGEIETYYDDLPEHILGRLAVMSMVEDGAFVPGVGFKHTEGMFYVAR